MVAKDEKPTALIDSGITSLDNEKELDKFLKENEDYIISQKVREYLMKMMNQHDVDRNDVVARSGLENYAYNILNGDKKAGRDKLIMMAIGFPLTREETDKLLELGGHNPLYAKNMRDAILIFAIKKEYSLMKTNECLYEHGLEILK